ncbi:MAG: FAD-dependent thymidylate synthase [Hyphomicrobiaceae bacterium]|nr:MAG: FAD-dependent thymidylate synthase [Hyphomicrobiaceae bacterium]
MVEKESFVKVIVEPSVYLVASSCVRNTNLQRFADEEKIEIKRGLSVGDCDLIPEIAGRLCYMSFNAPRPGGNKAYLEHILDVGHGSVLEHSVWSFIFTGISRSCSHELIRHRAGFGFSQLSQRYVDESDVAFVVPYGIHINTPAYEVWLRSMESARDAYVVLASELLRANKDETDRTMARKKARQEARSVLPNATETKIFVTGNARSWRNFIEQRASKYADREIRHLANKVLDVLQEESSVLFSDYEKHDLGDYTYEVTTNHKKV